MERKLFLILRWALFALACAFLYRQLFMRQDTHALLLQLVHQRRDPSTPVLIAVMVLTIVNWGLESWKWQRAIGPLERISFLRAFKATIAGTTLGLFTPNRTGEFLGRVAFLQEGHRISGAFATALASLAQFVTTLVFGTVSLAFLLWTRPGADLMGASISPFLVSLCLIVSAGAMVLYVFPGLLRQAILLVPAMARADRHVRVLQAYPRSELLAMLLISALRYAVFTVQFALLLVAFGAIDRLGTAMLLVPVIYLITTLIPTMLLTELGVRGSVAVALLLPFGAAEVPVLMATFTIWLFNLLMPAAVGAFLILFYRSRRSEQVP